MMMRPVFLAFLAFASAEVFCSPQASAEAQTVRLAHSYIAAVPAVLREKGFLEKALADRNVEVQWVTALGSNKTSILVRPAVGPRWSPAPMEIRSMCFGSCRTARSWLHQRFSPPEEK